MICSGNQEPVMAQGQGNAEQRIHGGEEGNLAGVLGGFHRHVEELLLRHAVLRSLAPADFVSTPTASSKLWPLASACLAIIYRQTGVRKRNGYEAMVGPDGACTISPSPFSTIFLYIKI